MSFVDDLKPPSLRTSVPHNGLMYANLSFPCLDRACLISKMLDGIALTLLVKDASHSLMKATSAAPF